MYFYYITVFGTIEVGGNYMENENIIFNDDNLNDDDIDKITRKSRLIIFNKGGKVLMKRWKK